MNLSTDTHIISFILNLGQRVDDPWPLDILDYQGKVNHVIMEPGDMVYYESARLPKLPGLCKTGKIVAEHLLKLYKSQQNKSRIAQYLWQ